MPIPIPLVQFVPKKATFGDSKTFTWVSSGFLRSSSASPVREALFTFSSLAEKRIISAGI